MHSNAQLIERLFTSLSHRDPQSMADCYHPDARFRDIAFDLRGKEQIHTMWRMICAGDIHATPKLVHVDDDTALVQLLDVYTFRAGPGAPGKKVLNAIISRFEFEDGLIAEQQDFCDPMLWADQAIGGWGGLLAGRCRWVRARAARKKLLADRKSVV